MEHSSDAIFDITSKHTKPSFEMFSGTELTFSTLGDEPSTWCKVEINFDLNKNLYCVEFPGKFRAIKLSTSLFKAKKPIFWIVWFLLLLYVLFDYFGIWHIAWELWIACGQWFDAQYIVQYNLHTTSSNT